MGTASHAGLVEALRVLVPRVLAATGTPGLNLAVARGDDLIHEQGFGLADVAAGRPMTPETVARAGSISKLYTATAVMQLVEEDRLALDEPVSSYVDFASRTRSASALSRCAT